MLKRNYRFHLISVLYIKKSSNLTDSNSNKFLSKTDTIAITFLSHAVGYDIETTLNGEIYPCASDTTYLNWLKDYGKDAIQISPGNLDIYIVNIGKYMLSRMTHQP